MDVITMWKGRGVVYVVGWAPSHPFPPPPQQKKYNNHPPTNIPLPLPERGVHGGAHRHGNAQQDEAASLPVALEVDAPGFVGWFVCLFGGCGGMNVR
jgi:hypothetical protein